MNQSFDLNLLRVLDILLEEKSVTATSMRLNLSQSAVSKHLAKLREMFNDPLLTRKSSRLIATPKAIELAHSIKPLLQNVEQLTRPNKFIPAQSSRRFHIDMIELAYANIIPEFMPEILATANNVKVNIQTWDQNTIEQLLNCEIEFGITCREHDPRSELHIDRLEPDLHYAELIQDHSVCLVRENHPLLTQPWNLDTFIQYRHIQVTGGGASRWVLDEVLFQQQLHRDIAIEMPDFQGAFRLCEFSDLLLCAPYRQVQEMIQIHKLKVLPLPINIIPGAFFLIWNQHFEHDLGHKWLRELIINNLKKQPPPRVC
ncbi:LysR family transcriptional regulator [Parashewanella spongiae]|uniref:LysR family transcriptional regulator n=1 Tax=Parashewanella spongiae TaxID=342950 RepID=A0A3A6TJK5_9GAMM|nr:LysR family transcriptional regulator [Parashewanella spongiae]MCL1076650.1 LysR family transcriptional regulator [Parashewanella spongiae]RJY12424.1 LysR family transcriptional regulator [Parashewanella spongiae]